MNFEEREWKLSYRVKKTTTRVPIMARSIGDAVRQAKQLLGAGVPVFKVEEVY